MNKKVIENAICSHLFKVICPLLPIFKADSKTTMYTKMVIALEAAVKLATVNADGTPASHCSAACLPSLFKMSVY
jgi:hypothetical protein